MGSSSGVLCSPSAAAPPAFEGTSESGRFFRLAPTTPPRVAAPLGWTLSERTRDELDAQLDTALRTTCSDAVAGAPRPVRCFLDAIGVPVDSPG